MKITGARAERFLSKPPDDLIGVLLFGPDRGLVRERGAALAKLFIKDPDDAFAVTQLTADDLTGDVARLSDEMSALSLLGDARLVRLRLDHERAGAAISKIIKELDANPERAEAKLIIEAGDMTTRSAIRKAFDAAGKFAAVGCYTDSAADVGNMVRGTLNDLGIKIEPDALAMWVPLLEGDRGLTRGEIEKMAVYKGYGTEAGASVTIEDIKSVAAGGQSASIDDIINFTMGGKVDDADTMFRRAVAGKLNTVVILFSLQRHISRLLEAQGKMQRGDSAENAIRSLRPPVFGMAQRDFVRQLNLWPSSALQRALSQTLDVEKNVKTAASPADALVGRLLLALSSFAARRH
ncbi:DNA polymerase III subunit delta [Fretibacter rubidus]|uniref:DNA polymerase III subunit delta n=1 Tax=Fretibacter rubidus TaxID=570162 RepID=UPI00352B8FA3